MLRLVGYYKEIVASIFGPVWGMMHFCSEWNETSVVA
jgi:hypothetical protein